MACPLCSTRKARRHCPALDQTICAPCCGTKRLVEIRCPAECPWLASAQAHPPASVLRQRDRDATVLAPMLVELPERAYLLAILLLDVVRRHRTGALPPLTDRDVQDAVAALAATYETAARGLIYDHPASALPAQRLLQDLRATVDVIVERAGGSPAVTREAAMALRKIEWGAREAAGRLADTPVTGTVFLDLLDRLPKGAPSADAVATEGAGTEPPSRDAPRIIIP